MQVVVLIRVGVLLHVDVSLQAGVSIHVDVLIQVVDFPKYTYPIV